MLSALQSKAGDGRCERVHRDAACATPCGERQAQLAAIPGRGTRRQCAAMPCTCPGCSGSRSRRSARSSASARRRKHNMRHATCGMRRAACAHQAPLIGGPAGTGPHAGATSGIEGPVGGCRPRRCRRLRLPSRLVPPTSAPGLGSPIPHLHQDRHTSPPGWCLVGRTERIGPTRRPRS